MARVVNTHEAKTHLSRLIDDALNGEEIVLARAGKPLIRLVPIREDKPPRPLGSAKGQFEILEGFDDSLEDMFEVLKEPDAE